MDILQNIKLPRMEKNNAVHMIASVTAATAILYSSYRLIFGREKNKQGIKEIPMPGSKYPYIGHLMSLGELPGRTFSKWHQELGPIIKIQVGRQVWISVDCPELAHKIFVTNGAETSYRPYAVFTHFYHGMNGKGMAFAQPGAIWKKCRIAALSILAPKQILGHLDSILNGSRNLVNSLITSTENEGSVDPLKYLELNSLNFICGAAFGRRFDSIDDPEFEKISNMVKTTIKFTGFEEDMANILPILSIVDYFVGKQAKIRRFINERNPTIRQLIKEATQKEGPNLVKSLEEDDGYDLNEDETLVFMFELTIGGMDTIATTLNWIIAILSHYPEVQEKISAEIDAFYLAHDCLPNIKDREEIPYCISVMKECMRYRPISPFGTAHSVQQDTLVDGYLLPKGCLIFPNNDSMHKNPERFPQPEQFIPERFMSNLKTMQSAANGKLEDRDHFIFGWGRRLCPAIYIAEVEVLSSFVLLFARCSIQPAGKLPDIEGAVNAGIVLAPIPYKIKIIKRTNALVQ